MKTQNHDFPLRNGWKLVYCWIGQSGLQSNLVDWIGIDDPYSKSDFGFELSIQFFHFNLNLMNMS